MATLVTVDVFAKDILEEQHNFASDVFKMALSNSAIAATITNYSGVSGTEIANGNGYTTGGLTLSCTTSTPATGQGAAIFADITLTASGGSIPTFRYGAIYNTNATTANRAVAVFDIGSAITLTVGQSHTFDFQGNSILVG